MLRICPKSPQRPLRIWFLLRRKYRFQRDKRAAQENKFIAERDKHNGCRMQLLLMTTKQITFSGCYSILAVQQKLVVAEYCARSQSSCENKQNFHFLRTENNACLFFLEGQAETLCKAVINWKARKQACHSCFHFFITGKVDVRYRKWNARHPFSDDDVFVPQKTSTLGQLKRYPQFGHVTMKYPSRDHLMSGGRPARWRHVHDSKRCLQP